MSLMLAIALAVGDRAPDGDSQPKKLDHPIVVTGIVRSPDGKPFAGARVEIVAYDRTFAWDRVRRKQDPIEYEHLETKSDAHGAFRFELRRNASQPPPSIALLASAEYYSPAARGYFQLHPPLHFELKLHEPKTLRLQFVDEAGNPVGGIDPRIVGGSLEGGQRWEAPGSLHKGSAWPRVARTDKEGYTTVTVAAPAKQLYLAVDDERFGTTSVRAPAGQKTTSVVLKRPRFVSGIVTAADSGKPLAGIEVRIRYARRWHRTDSEGRFRVEAWDPGAAFGRRQSEFEIEVKPPSDSDYLPRTLESAWPGEVGDADVAVKLKRGLVVEGRVVEQATGKGVKQALIFFVPQGNNPLRKKFERTNEFGRDIPYATDAEGRFRVPVVPGPGYLLVQGPSLDYVHTEFSRGEQLFGKPGLEREYYDAVTKINLKPDERPQPLTIALQRGVTLRRKVVRPDGAPAAGIAFARSYLEFESRISAANAAVVVDDGVFELPGFDTKQPSPIYVVDFEHHCGGVVKPKPSEIDTASPPIRLEACGTAKVRFLNSKGKADAGYRPEVQLTITPGPSMRARERPNQPLMGEHVYWVNVYWRAGVRFSGGGLSVFDLRPVADAEGRLTIRDLIPGAAYQIEYQNGTFPPPVREFSVRPGETVDLGDIVIGKQ
jgi:hypothetical protein